MEKQIVNDIDLNELTDAVRLWFDAKGITSGETKAKPAQQFNKLLEEVQETAQALGLGIRADSNSKSGWSVFPLNIPVDQKEVMDGIGDCAVVLIGLAELCGTSFEECLSTAYGVISKRTGKMVDGIFIKDA
jgi:NTP pyrophosphatase (non-canonical NTP hydrolase)